MNGLDTTFAALSDPTRRAILARLAESDATVGELAEPFAVSLPAISRHLKVLESADLITNIRVGKHRRCSLNPQAMRSAADWLEFYRRFWGETLDKLDEHLRKKGPRS